MEHKNKTALIAMSGGVDSSVTAYLMKEAGFTCLGANPTLPRNQKSRIKKSKEFQRFSLLFYCLYGIIF